MPFPAALVDHEGNYPWTDGVSYPEATPHNIHLNSIDALEEKVGIDDSADTDSFDYILKNLVETGYVRYTEVAAYNVDGAELTASTWEKRVITTKDDDPQGLHVSLTNGVIVLEAGTYRANIYCPVHACDQFFSRLRNTSGTPATLIQGCTANGGASVASTQPGWIQGQFTVAASQNLEIQTYCTDTGYTGENHGVSGYSNIYTVAEFFRVGL